VDAEDFDRWYANMAKSPAQEEIQQRALGLPPELQSSSLLTWDGLGEVVEALQLHSGQVFLDLACGRGGYGLEIARRTGARMIGVDFSGTAIDLATRRAAARGMADVAEFRVGELTGTGLDAASVDALVCVDALQFALPVSPAIDECLRILRPGGRLTVTCWEAVDRADTRVPDRIRQLDLAVQLPAAGFVNVRVAGRPDWREAELRMWLEAAALDPAGDPALESMREEGTRVLAMFDATRRVIATAVRP
jgi:SAM-dependent methyltransferase